MKKVGFTLAEVLITLGIIGVVAAMTIPNLIANTRSSQYRSAFKKAVSTLSQAARMSQAQYDFDYAGINTRCQNGATDHPEQIMSICSIINGTLTGVTFYNSPSELKLKDGNSYSLNSTYLLDRGFNNSNILIYQLADGSIFGFSKNLGDNPCSLPIGTPLTDRYDYTGEAGQIMNKCVGFIDVNGTTLPNKEVSCSSGSNLLANNNCIVKNDAQHMTDIYPIRIHDGVVEPATAAARYVLKTTK